MSTPQLLRRNQPAATIVPVTAPRRPDPLALLTAPAFVASISSVVFAVISVGLLVLAVMVVATHLIDQPAGGKELPSWASSSDVIAQFAMWLAIAFFAVLAFNVAAITVRHVRKLRQGL